VTLALYFTRAFAGRFLAVLLGFAAVLQLLDLLDNAGTVLEQGQGATDMLTYISLRLPMVVNQIVPLAVLIAALTSFFSFARRSEVIAMRSVGVSPWRLLWLLVPAVAVVALLHVVLLGQVVPWSEQALRDWWDTNIAEPEPQEPSKPVWLRAGRDIISIATVDDEGRHLTDVTVVTRDDRGRVDTRIVADQAQWDAGEGWTLLGADITTLENGIPETAHQTTVSWTNGPTPENIAFVAEPPQFLSPQRSLSILQGTWSGTRPLSYYQTQLQGAFSIPLSSFVMLLLAQPALRGVRRGERFGAGAAIGLALGMLFLLVQGLLSALGETNTLPPILAVWSPLILFACVGGTILLSLEE